MTKTPKTEARARTFTMPSVAQQALEMQRTLQVEAAAAAGGRPGFGAGPRGSWDGPGDQFEAEGPVGIARGVGTGGVGLSDQCGRDLGEAGQRWRLDLNDVGRGQAQIAAGLREHQPDRLVQLAEVTFTESLGEKYGRKGHRGRIARRPAAAGRRARSGLRNDWQRLERLTHPRRGILVVLQFAAQILVVCGQIEVTVAAEAEEDRARRALALGG